MGDPKITHRCPSIAQPLTHTKKLPQEIPLENAAHTLVHEAAALGIIAATETSEAAAKELYTAANLMEGASKALLARTRLFNEKTSEPSCENPDPNDQYKPSTYPW